MTLARKGRGRGRAVGSRRQAKLQCNYVHRHAYSCASFGVLARTPFRDFRPVSDRDTSWSGEPKRIWVTLAGLGWSSSERDALHLGFPMLHWVGCMSDCSIPLSQSAHQRSARSLTSGGIGLNLTLS